MSLGPADIYPVDSAQQAEDDSYVDPILFAEGAYADQQDYEQTIDDLADRINRGVAVPRGREAREDLLLEELPAGVDAAKLAEAMSALEPDLRIILEMNFYHKFSDDKIAQELKITRNQVAGRRAAAWRIISRILMLPGEY